MTTPRHRILRTAAAVGGLLATGCSTHQRPPTHATRAPSSQGGAVSPSGASADRRTAVIPSESPATRPATVTPDPAPTPPAVPQAARTTATAVGTARAWSIAANSSSYLDPSAGTWTVRARPFVTGIEASAEAVQHDGGGGSTWAQIQAGMCVTSLRDLTAFIPSDAPSGPDVHIVYVSATVALTCAADTVQLSDFAAQLTVRRMTGRWLVALVSH